MFKICSHLIALGMLGIFLVSCTNMPTPPSQITGAYTSELKYMDYACDQLAIEINALARREAQLVIAQEQRIKTSKTQAFFRGYGEGDGIEASELAVVRGEKEAVRTAMERKQCSEASGKTNSSAGAAIP